MLKKFKTYQMAKKLYQEGQKLKLKGIIKDQFDRASLSIVLNLAEGSGKRTAKDRKRFYHNSLGSLREVQALLDIIDNNQLSNQYDQLGAMLWKLFQNPGSLIPGS